MDDLLPHYERELAFLRTRAADFGRMYPKVAGRLQLSTDVGDDPHVERMLESLALLTARVHKRLDDDFPLFTESLLEVLYPHYLRPFPSASIAQFDPGAAIGQMTKSVVVERGTMLDSRAVKGVPCKFRTTQDVTLMPVRVASATYRNAVTAPEGTRLPAGATSVMSITLELTSPQASWEVLSERPLRFFLDGEPSQVCALREALCHKVRAVMVQGHPHQPWLAADPGGHQAGTLPALAGFADEEALIDADARSHAAYRLLTEYFAFPEKFNFVDMAVSLPVAFRHDPPGVAAGAGLVPDEGTGGAVRRSVTVHLLMSGVRADSDESRMLEALSARHLLLGCTPVVNLFRQPADPIRVTHTMSSYPVVVDGRRAFAYELYSIDRVFRVRQTPQGETVQAFRPFFSLQHEDLLGGDDGDGASGNDAPTLAARRRAREGGLGAEGRGGGHGRYWAVHRDETTAALSPGHEYELSIVDVDFNLALPQTDTLSLTVTATNRDLPALLAFGTPGGDLFMEGGPAREVRLLRKPTPTQRFDRGRGALWRLISHLSLNHLSLSGGGVDALKEMLRLYDLPRSASNRRQIDGVKAIDFKPATAWLPGEPYATFVRGTEIRVSVAEDGFVGTGLGLFAAMLDRFFGLYVHTNSFARLTIVSDRTQEVVFSCPPRNGDMQLL